MCLKPLTNTVFFIFVTQNQTIKTKKMKEICSINLPIPQNYSENQVKLCLEIIYLHALKSRKWAKSILFSLKYKKMMFFKFAFPETFMELVKSLKTFNYLCHFHLLCKNKSQTYENDLESFRIHTRRLFMGFFFMIDLEICPMLTALPSNKDRP